ncbi:MAG: TonB-dependent receptor [Candidatus Eremiobacteraeota bacterium]|nr:TonB-dependent receptor [Candidatus Eremiobacteraeota bacterium]MBV8498685.1 TonB-dependent receptor [Candidatus Eremiobacteraeota bacterium]
MKLRILMTVLVLCVVQLTPVQAGTTGGISGIVSEFGTATPLAGVAVSVTSPSQSASTTTDARGHFAFVSLAPDEYTISLKRAGYSPISYAGIAVFADAQQTLTLSMRVALKTIANVTSRSSSSLVRPGTTADLYSVNAAQQERTAVLGGGGALNSAYSAIASVPGAYVPANQNGYLQAVHVRGGDAYEVGYEFDGIPINRAFDNFPSGSLSSLGQLELQVYTGATPSNAEAQGLAGFVNQVIKTGTFPGYATLNASAGTPTFYHSLNVEAGGATPDREFSYYVGIGGYNQDHRYVDQFGGAAYTSEFGQLIGTCPAPSVLHTTVLPSCYTNGSPNVGLSGTPGWILGPTGFGTINAANVATRTAVANVHIAIPHRNDGLRDDIQLLYDNDEIFTTFLSSVNDEGYANWINTVGAFPPYYLDSYQYRGPLGSFLPANPSSLVTPYLYPSSPPHPLFGPIPDPWNQRDRGYNGQAIVKLQYQKNFNSSAFLRVYGYTYYSDWIENGPMMSLQPYAFYDSGDYEINNHTRGVSISFTDQLSPQNLIEAEGSYTTATGARIYNEQMFGSADSFAVLVNRNNPNSGTCYALAGPSSAYTTTPTTCSDGGASGVVYGKTLPSFASLSGIYGGTPPPNLSGVTCGGGPCGFYVVENGAYGLNNTVTPYFAGYSFNDEWRPNDRLFVNAGVRVDNYSFVGANTVTGAARAFWFDAFNQDTCYDTQTLTLVDRTALIGNGSWSTNSQKPCSAFGGQYVNANLQNIPGSFDYNIPQPRFGVTYTVSPDTVLRASYGRYNEQPSSAYEQYNGLQQNLPDTLSQFYSLGFTTPGHEVAPSVSYNSDFSIEHHFKGTEMSFKLTPFLRQTQDQVENFYINYVTGLTSGLNAGYQTSSGFEFQFDKGDFSRNGFSGQLSFAYTYATVKYGTLPNGTTVISPINAGISGYNAYTAACAPSGNAYGKRQFGEPMCGATSNGKPPAPCYSKKGIPAPNCPAGSIANPYWRSPAFSLFDPTASYLPFSIFPGPIGSGVNAYNYPYVATLLLNYKHNRFTITPSLQFVAGNRYGAPLTTPGIDPASGCGPPLPGSTAGDSRYPYGAAGGGPFNANAPHCAATLSIPDPYTGQFDAIGAFREPAQLLGHLQLGYELSPRVSLTVTLANLLQTCFGGQHTAFTYYWSNSTCLYTNLIGGPTTPPVGNAYNPGANVQTFLRYPYEPYFGTYNDQTSSLNTPFNAYVSVKLKI